MGILREISAVDVSQYDDGETLLILKETFAELRTSEGEFKTCTSSWISADAEVSYQRRCDGVVYRQQARFHEVTKLLAGSRPEDSILLMDENVLDGEVAKKVLEKAPRYLQEDWFEQFPEDLRPWKICLVLGGLGARSELHLDPLSWTGWNCLLEGMKLWRFYTSTTTFEGVLRPFGMGPKAEFCSIGASVISSIDTWMNNPNNPERLPVPVEYVQRPGETLIFPGTWWHQTYHLSPTVALAGQVLNQRNLHRVMGHIITHCNLKVEKELWEKEPKEVICEVLGDAIDAMWRRSTPECCIVRRSVDAYWMDSERSRFTQVFLFVEKRCLTVGKSIFPSNWGMIMELTTLLSREDDQQATRSDRCSMINF